MICYLSGPMSNQPDWNYPAFHKAASVLRSKGHIVHSPAEQFNGETGLPKTEYMRRDILLLLVSEAVCILPGWLGSEGARCELTVALALGLPIYLYEKSSVERGDASDISDIVRELLAPKV